MAIPFKGFLLTALGIGVESATVDVVDRNTTTPVRETTTTDSNGFYSLSESVEGRYDVRITSGTDIIWRKYDTASQMEELEVATLKVRNPADTFVYNFLPAAIVANRTLNLPLSTGTETLMGTVTQQAAQSAIEAQTNEDTYVPPDLIKHSPGVAKGWCRITAAGALAVPSHNVASITDTATGDRTIVWDVDFADVDYVINGMIAGFDSGNGTGYNNHAVGSIQIGTFTGTTLTDFEGCYSAFGDQ